MKKVMLFLLIVGIAGLVGYFVNPGFFKRINESITPKQLALPVPDNDSVEAKKSAHANMDVCTFCHGGKAKCSVCSGSRVVNKQKCKNCLGTGWVTCSHCHGTGFIKRKLKSTVSAGVFGHAMNSGRDGDAASAKQVKIVEYDPGDLVKCKTCNGTGMIDCPKETITMVTAIVTQAGGGGLPFDGRTDAEKMKDYTDYQNGVPGSFSNNGMSNEAMHSQKRPVAGTSIPVKSVCKLCNGTGRRVCPNCNGDCYVYVKHNPE